MAQKVVIVYDDDEGDELTWEVGGIYKYHNPKIHTHVQHRFILCVKLENNRGLFVYCTSQEGTMNYLMESKGYEAVTLPYIRPDGAGTGNHFTKDTFVNCNEPLDECLIDLGWKHEDGDLERIGTISLSDFDQIRTAMYESTLVPNIYPKSMKYPGEED